MLGVLDEARLQAAIVEAVQLLQHGARQLPESGGFPPLLARFDARTLVRSAGDVELCVGFASTEKSGRMRYLNVKVFTPSGRSDSSCWLVYGRTDEVRRALEDRSLVGRISTTIQEAVISILRHELS